MRIGSLFSGAGGLDMAVEQVFGGHTVWHCEVDKAASKVLAHRWPDVPNLGDITTIDWESFAWRKRGDGPAIAIDVLCGGWPCQPFSLAGKRKGIDDERALWPHVARAIRALRPRYVVLENVSAVLGSPEFDRVANSLAEAGYSFSWTCLRASGVGAPHRRERLFVVAYDSDTPTQRRGATGRDNGLRDARLGALDGDGPVELLPTPRSADANGGGHYNTGPQDILQGALVELLLPTPRTSDTNGAGVHGDGGLDLRTAVTLLPTPTQSDGTGGGIRTGLSWEGPTKSTGDGGNSRLRDVAGLLTADVQWGKYEPAIRRWENVTRPAPAPTEPNKNGNPRLSAAFSEWLMGWPAGHVTEVPGISRNDQLRIIGNGVVPQQAEAALQYLLSVAEMAA